MYVLNINTGTQKATALLQYLSADQTRLIRDWPETIGLSDAIQAKIDALDWGWFIDDLQKANIERLGNGQYQLTMEHISETTPAVIETLLATNNRQGHAHFRFAYFQTQKKQFIPIHRGTLPHPFQ